MRFTYSKEQLDFIRETFMRLGVKETTLAFNQRFNLAKTENNIKAVISNHKFKCGRKQGELTKGKYRSFTQEQFLFIESGYKKWSISELTEKFNLRFGTSKTECQIKSFTKNHKIRSGRTGEFKKGHKPFNTGTKGVSKPNKTSFKRGRQPENHRKVGSERINADGYVEIKVAEPNIWMPKQRAIYEQAFGKIPKNHKVRFLDGDKENFSPSNLVLVSNTENAYLNRRYQLNQQPEELRETLVLMAKIDAKEKSLTER